MENCQKTRVVKKVILDKIIKKNVRDFQGKQSTESSEETVRDKYLKNHRQLLYTVSNQHVGIRSSAIGFALLLNLDNIKGTLLEFNVACYGLNRKRVKINVSARPRFKPSSAECKSCILSQYQLASVRSG